MDLGLHELTQGLIHQTMALEQGTSGELAGNKGEAKMPATARRACMAQVFMTLVDDLKLGGVEGFLEPLADGRYPFWREHIRNFIAFLGVT